MFGFHVLSFFLSYCLTSNKHCLRQNSAQATWENAMFFVFFRFQVLNIVDTNNGVKAQNKAFKYGYLPRSSDKSVFGTSVMLVEMYVPADCHQRYLQCDVQLSSTYRRYNVQITSYLHNRPPHFIKHCLRQNSAQGTWENAISMCWYHKGCFLCKKLLTEQPVSRG